MCENSIPLMRLSFRCLLLAFLVSTFSLDAFTQNAVQRESDDQEQIKPPDWNTLQFFGERRVTRMLVRLNLDPQINWDRLPGHDERADFKLEFEIGDEMTLDYITKRLSNGVHRSPENSGNVLSWERLGTIELTDSTGATIEIGISNAGFVLGSDAPHEKNLFYSWGLAKILERHAKTKFHQYNFKALSGSFFIDEDKASFDELFSNKK